MIDHIGVNVADLDASRRFYQAALKPFGWAVQKEAAGGAHLGFGTPQMPFFWIGTGTPPSTGCHVALAAPDRATVDAFHAAALAAGGRDNGRPGLRPQYHPGYYGAFVLDPDGNNIEAVCHRRE